MRINRTQNNNIKVLSINIMQFLSELRFYNLVKRVFRKSLES